MTPTRILSNQTQVDLNSDTFSGSSTLYVFNDLIILTTKKGKNGFISSPLALCWTQEGNISLYLCFILNQYLIFII